MNTLYKRFYKSSATAIPKAVKTIWWLLKIIIPISLIVSFLQYWGFISQLATMLSPAFSFIGLPGESAVVFITSIFLPLYAPIAIISSLPLDMREITILALMCLISHNLFVETAVQKKTGSSAFIMFFLRIGSSIIVAFILNQLLPIHVGTGHTIQQSQVFGNIQDILHNWFNSTCILSLKISLIITGLMILQNILKEFNILNVIARIFAPFIRLFGLTDDCSFLWFIAQTLGLAYGSAVSIEAVESETISLKNANLLNYHVAINHSLLEDTLLFVSIGVPVLWIVAPRLIMAIFVVWSIKVITKLICKIKEVSKIIIREY